MKTTEYENQYLTLSKIHYLLAKCLNKDCGGVYSLGTASQRQLGHVLVGDLKDNGFAFAAAVGHANLNASLNIKVRYLDLGGEDIPVPVIFHGGCSLGRLST